MTAGIISLSVILLMLLVYILLTFVFLDALSKRPPDDLSETFATAEVATTNDDTLPSDLLEQVSASPIASPEPSSAQSSVHTSTPCAMPDDFDLPVSEVPEFYPDILGFRDAEYGDMPVFATVNVIYTPAGGDPLISVFIAGSQTWRLPGERLLIFL